MGASRGYIDISGLKVFNPFVAASSPPFAQGVSLVIVVDKSATTADTVIEVAHEPETVVRNQFAQSGPDHCPGAE
jgi:hypothetical protein